VAWVRIGAVARPLGLQGRVGVAGTEGLLGRLPRVSLRWPDGKREVRRVRGAHRQGRLWALQLEGVEDRSAAEALRGAEVWAERSEMGEAGPGRHFWADLEGLPVRTVEGEEVGRVVGLLETGGVDVLVVQGARGELLVPLAPYVQVGRQEIRVDPPEGLFEAAATDGEGKRGGRDGWRRSRSRS
jgi:16S rRNA processing protein RimM